MEEKRHTCRRWPQFSLRTLFVMLTLVSIFLAWVGYSMNLIYLRRKFVAEHDQAFIRFAPCKCAYTPNFLWVFGEKKYCMWNAAVLTKDELEKAQQLFPEAYISD